MQMNFAEEKNALIYPSAMKKKKEWNSTSKVNEGNTPQKNNTHTKNNKTQNKTTTTPKQIKKKMQSSTK